VSTNLIRNLRFHISPEHFPGYKVITPVYAYVEYFIDQSYNAYITGIMFPPDPFQHVSGRSRIVEEIELAVASIADDLQERRMVIC
jgi:hypothetical protein